MSHSTEVRLRPLEEKDVDGLLSTLQDPITRTFISLPDPYTWEMAHERMSFLQRTKDFFAWTITHPDYGDTFIGQIDFRPHDSSLGYMMHPDYRGKGYLIQAIKEVIRLTDCPYLLIRTADNNYPSQAAAQAAGFQLIGSDHPLFTRDESVFSYIYYRSHIMKKL